MGACLERALAATDPSAQPIQSPLPPSTAPKVTLSDPFEGINPPPPALLTEALEKSQHEARTEPSRGCSLTRRTESPGGLTGEKRRSNSCHREEVEAKRGWQSEVQPAWNISNIGSRRTTQSSTSTSTGRHTGSTPRHERQSEGRRSRPATKPDSPEHLTKLKSAIATVKDKTPNRTSYESMGPAARSRYEDPGSSRDSDREGQKTKDNNDRRTREKSRQHSDSDRHRESRSRTGSSRKEESCSHSRYQESRPKDRNSGRTQSKLAEKRGFDKSAACKEYEECYDKVVTHPRKYLEERYPQINLEFYRAEVHAMRYFGPTAEEATIQVLTLIDWAA